MVILFLFPLSAIVSMKYTSQTSEVVFRGPVVVEALIISSACIHQVILSLHRSCKEKKDFFIASWIILFFAQKFYCTCGNILKYVPSFFRIFEAMDRIVVKCLRRRVRKRAKLESCKTFRRSGHTSSHSNLNSGCGATCEAAFQKDDQASRGPRLLVTLPAIGHCPSKTIW